MLLLCSVLNRQKKPLDGKSGGKEGRETTSAGGRRREWLLDFMFQLYVDGRMYEYVRLLLYWSASRAAASLLSERIKGGCFRGIVGARKSSILCILPL